MKISCSLQAMKALSLLKSKKDYALKVGEPTLVFWSPYNGISL